MAEGVVDDIRHWIATWNTNPRPFTWAKTAGEILNSLADYLAKLSTGNPSKQAASPPTNPSFVRQPGLMHARSPLQPRAHCRRLVAYHAGLSGPARVVGAVVTGAGRKAGPVRPTRASRVTNE